MGQCRSSDVVKQQEQCEDFSQLDYNRYSTYQKLESIATGIVQDQQINASYSALIQRVIAARQDHILKLLQSMNTNEKNSFIFQLEHVDFETVDSLYHHCYKQQQMDAFKANLIENTLQFNRENGLKLIKERKVGIIFLCGGNSSRLPNKLLKDIGLPSKKCALQNFMEKLKKIIYMSQEDEDDVRTLKNFPIGILVSNEDQLIKQYLKSKSDFGFPYIHIMQQKSIPIINTYGQLVFEKNSPSLSPDGTGTVFKQLYNFISKYPNLQQIHLFGCDNLVGLPLDPLMLGNDIDVICKTIDTNYICDDRMFYQNGYFKTLEAQDSSMTQNPENLTKMCLNDMYVSVSFLKQLKQNHEKQMKFQQRFHAIKRCNAIQFEKHIQDIMEIANTVYLYNTEDYALLIDDPKRAVIQLSNVHKKYLKIEGTQEDQLVEISPYMSYCGEDLKRQDKTTITFPLII